MKALRHSPRLLPIAALAALLVWCVPAQAQTFSSGSTGADGAFSPSANTVVTLPPDGVLNYTTVTIPAGVTVTFQRNQSNTPVTMLATGDVTINGTISVNGAPGLNGSSTATIRAAGGAGGPGGFRGGDGGMPGLTMQSGQGPGGGLQNCSGGTYGASSTFVSLLPLFGGSGGSGGTTPGSGSSSGGGGGGGAIVIASSSKIVVAGTISANGGAGGIGNQPGGGGSGGAIRLVAPVVAGAGSLTATWTANWTCDGGNGRIRIEAFSNSFSGALNPGVGAGASLSTTVGPVTPASNPALAALPTISIASVGGAAAPAAPGGSFTQADVTVPQGTANPVPVVVAATNTPLGASVRVVMVPQAGASTTSAPLTLSGTFSSSSVTTSVTLPAGSVSVLQAWATMTLTGQIAGLFPPIDGEPVQTVALASPGADGKPAFKLITGSGKERSVDELPAAEQLQVARAWQLMGALR
jgi:hypothetical protein